MATQKTTQEESDTQRLQNVDPYDFEEFVGELWRRQGYDVDVTQSSNDRGIDAVATRSDGAVGFRVGLQAKRHTSQIGPDKVRQYAGVRTRERDLDQIIVVATTTFSDGAQEEAKEMNVKLVGIDRLLELLDELDARDLLNRYAPDVASTELDPANTQTDEERADVQIANDTNTQTELPEPFNDEETRKRSGAVVAALGVLSLVDPFGAGGVMLILGTLLTAGGAAFALAGDELYDSFTPDVTVYREFQNGAEVVEVDGETYYQRPGDRDEKTFAAFDDPKLVRQQANLYGVLDQKSTGEVKEMDGGIPTDVVSEGEAAVASYRFAVQDDRPEQIAAEMNKTQQEIVSLLESYSRSV